MNRFTSTAQNSSFSYKRNAKFSGMANRIEGQSETITNSVVGNQLDLSVVEHDGRAVNTSHDPPGQQSIYILPGNQEEESYRVTTFARFPTNAPINTRQLATNGFCYTGYKDRVKCFRLVY